MAQIIRDRKIIEDDWVRVEDGAPLPPAGRVIVSHARWTAEKEALRGREIGVAIPADLDVSGLAGDLPHLALVAIPFVFIQPRPEGGRTFDGRGHSQARLLRERYGFRGEIRAFGDLFRDVIFAMHRCGINAFELPTGRDLGEALKAFGDFSLGYQGAADDPTPIFRRRA